MARKTVPATYDLPAIASAAGQVDNSKVRYENGELIVDDVTQASLDAAVAGYDDLPRLKRTKRQELLLAFKADYAAVWLIDGIEVEEQKDAILAKTAANRTANETSLVNQAGTLITKIKTKFTDVNNATTEAQVQAIVW